MIGNKRSLNKLASCSRGAVSTDDAADTVTRRFTIDKGEGNNNMFNGPDVYVTYHERLAEGR